MVDDVCVGFFAKREQETYSKVFVVDDKMTPGLYEQKPLIDLDVEVWRNDDEEEE